MTRDLRECDVCSEVKECTLQYGNMWYCDECWTREQESVKQHIVTTPQIDEAQAKRNELANRVQAAMIQGQMKYGGNAAAIPINAVLQDSRNIDYSIQVRTDLFNAATKSILELKKAIDEDSSIDNKPYALASALKDRFEHFKGLIFELNQKAIEYGNEQRAIQTHLNTMSNQLRQEEREKLKIADINYKPSPPKQIKVKSVSTTGTKKKTKLDKAALRTAAQQLGVSEFTLQMLITAKGISLDEAVTTLKASLEAAKSSN